MSKGKKGSRAARLYLRLAQGIGGPEIRELLELVRLSYRFGKVKVQFLRDYPELPTYFGLVSVKRGEEVELPRWQAQLLKAMGYVEIKEALVDISYINKQHFKEKKGSSPGMPEHLPSDFYFRASQFVAALDSLLRKETSHAVLRDREAAERNILDLAERRLVKILSSVTADPKEARGRVTPEEEILLLILSDAVETWREYIRRVARGEVIG